MCEVEQALGSDAEPSLAADSAIACFSSSLCSFSLAADRAAQLKAGVGDLRKP